MKIQGYYRNHFPEMELPYQEVRLAYTDHALSRMTERTRGSLNILPRKITISKKNLKQIWIEEPENETEVRRIKSMLVEIPYTRGVLLQLVISSEFAVITLYFRETWRKTTVKDAEPPVLESIVSVTSPELLSNPPRLDDNGQVIYPKGTYFPGKQGKLKIGKKNLKTATGCGSAF